MSTYKVIWHNEHACDSLGEFNTEQEAISAGEEWQLQMIGIDPEGADEYCYEVLEVEEPDEEEKLAAEYAEEASYDYFNRYIAGDR